MTARCSSGSPLGAGPHRRGPRRPRPGRRRRRRPRRRDPRPAALDRHPGAAHPRGSLRRPAGSGHRDPPGHRRSRRGAAGSRGAREVLMALSQPRLSGRFSAHHLAGLRRRDDRADPGALLRAVDLHDRAVRAARHHHRPGPAARPARRCRWRTSPTRSGWSAAAPTPEAALVTTLTTDKNALTAANSALTAEKDAAAAGSPTSRPGREPDRPQHRPDRPPDRRRAESAERLSANQALEASLAQARTELDAGAEAARLAAARREALEALVASLQQDTATLKSQTAEQQAALDAAARATADQTAKLERRRGGAPRRSRRRRGAAQAARKLRRRADGDDPEPRGRAQEGRGHPDPARRRRGRARPSSRAPAPPRSATPRSAPPNSPRPTRCSPSRSRSPPRASARSRCSTSRPPSSASSSTRCRACSTPSKAKDVAAQVQIEHPRLQPQRRARPRRGRGAAGAPSSRPSERSGWQAEATDLESYRSEFFGQMREILGEREGVQVVGDRFVFPSEVLFAARLGHPRRRGPGPGRPRRPGHPRDRRPDPARHQLDPPRRRPHRQDPGQRRQPVPGQLGAERGPRPLGRALHRRGPGPAARPPRRHRLRRVPAHRPRRQPRGAGAQPPHRAQVHRALGRRCPGHRLVPR